MRYRRKRIFIKGELTVTSALFTPQAIGPIELTNRIVVAPMCQYSANDGSATDWHHMHLSSLAISGAALVITEATAVERRGRISHGCLGLYSDDNEASLSRVLYAAKRLSPTTKHGIQLAHAGRKGSCKRPQDSGSLFLQKDQDPWQTVAPSAIAFDKDWHVPEALDTKDMQTIMQAFIQAAKRAVRVGYDLIELHSAHGYLMHQFLSPLTNKRQDSYGGSLENRMRFPLEVAFALREAVPKHIALGARISGTDWAEGGATIEEAIIYAKKLKNLGFDFVCVSSGAIAPNINIPIGSNYQVPLATAVKNEAKIVTRTVGMIKSPEQANEIIQSGQADLVALARAFLDDPRWGWHAADTLGVQIPCPIQYARCRPPHWQRS